MSKCNLKSKRVAENNSNIKKRDVSKNAASVLSRAKEIYIRSLKIKEMPKEIVQRLSTKYTHMQTIAKNKVQAQEEKWKLRRNEYLEHLKKMKESKEAEERSNKQKTDRILYTRQIKDEQAKQTRMKIIEEATKRRVELITKRQADFKRLRLQRERESSQRKSLQEKQEAEKVRTSKLRSYHEYVKAMREEIALKLKQETIIGDLSNPYIVAEMNNTNWKPNAKSTLNIKGRHNQITAILK